MSVVVENELVIVRVVLLFVVLLVWVKVLL